MPRWLPGWKCATVGQLVLLALTAITSQDSWSAQRELRWVSPSRISTLDAYISPQDSQLDATLSDSINRGITTERKSTAKHKVATRTQSIWKAVDPSRRPTA